MKNITVKGKEIDLRIFGMCGMLSPVIFTMMWIIGGFLYPGYNHIRDDISLMLAIDSPIKLLMDIMNIAASIFLLIFVLGLHESITNGEGSKIGPIVLVIASVLGLLVSLFFPLGPTREDPRSTVHAAMVFAQVPFSAIGMIAIWRRLKKQEEWKLYGTISLVCFVLIMSSGMITPMVLDTAIMGLVERIGVCGVEAFFFVLGLGIYKNNNNNNGGD